jgi:hypothetical protein
MQSVDDTRSEIFMVAPGGRIAMSIDRPRMARELIRWSVIGSDLKTYRAPDCCFDAISSREPVSTSLETR